MQQTLSSKIKAEVVQTLAKGHFLVAAENKVTLVYVWAHGVPEEMSIRVAKGEIAPEVVQEYLLEKHKNEVIVKAEEKFISVGMQEIAKVQEFKNLIQSTAAGSVPLDSVERRVEALSLRLDRHIKETETSLESQKEMKHLLEEAKKLSFSVPQIPSELMSSSASLTEIHKKVTVEAVTLSAAKFDN